MPKWNLPYTVHNYTDEEFQKAKTDYVAKYGYSVYLPGWEDVVHIGLEKSFTEDEEIRWGKKDWDSFTPERLSELQAIKAKRKQMYQRLLSSPQPGILQTRGSIITALDNTQDGLSTLSMIIRIAYSVIPRVWGSLLAGPVGWIMTTSDILNLCTHTITPEYASIRNKRIKDKITEKNPFSRKARIRRKAAIFKKPLSSGTVIEALQTTDIAFGYGISLGAIMNLPLDMFFGNIRTLDGQKVTIREPIEQPAFWKNQASLAYKSLTTLFTTDKIFDVATALPLLILSHLTAVAMHVIAPTLDPNNEIVDLESYVSRALIPRKSYLIEVIQEAGDNPMMHLGWPLTGKLDSSITEIAERGAAIASKNFQEYCINNRYNLEGFYAAQRAVDAIHFSMATITDDDSVEYDYIAAEKTTHALLNSGYRFPFYMTFPSGFWEGRNDLPKNDIIQTVLDAYKKHYPYPEWTPEGVFETGPSGLLLAMPNLSRRDSWRDVVAYRDLSGNFILGPATADVANITQLLLEFPEDNLLINPTGPSVDALRRALANRIASYFDDHEANGSTPSLPSFIKWSKDTLGVLYPVNETPREASIIPEILPPPEIP